MPRPAAAQATWQRDSIHSTTVRSCLARGNLAKMQCSLSYCLVFFHPHVGLTVDGMHSHTGYVKNNISFSGAVCFSSLCGFYTHCGMSLELSKGHFILMVS